MKKQILIAALMTLTVAAAHAVPAKPVKKTVRTADGSTVALTLRGDEHFSFYTDDQGQAYRLNADRRAYRVSADEVGQTWTKRRDDRLRYSRQQAARRAQQRAALKPVWQQSPRPVGGASAVTTGKHRGLVILMQFSDVKFVTASPQATFHRFFNEEGYSDGGMAGSVRDYFLAQSYGQLEIDFDVVGPYTTKGTMAYYGAPTDTDNDAHPGEMVAEAVDAAAADVDYSNYDWDGDGIVDQVFVIYAGYNEAQWADENTIWPHEWDLYSSTGEAKQYNGVYINTYGCSSELRGDGKTDMGIIDGIGTACHEFSHCLGLPDMYDTSGGDNYAMAYWDVMCSGSYNNNSLTPAGYTSYERWFSGWMEPTELTTETTVTGMKPLADKPEAYILYNEGNRNEYYLLENRQPSGFDAGLYGHGLLVVHVDYSESVWQSNTVNNVAGHQRMAVIAADNEYVSSMLSLQGDPYPGVKGNTSLTNYTTPAATVFNKNTDGSLLMNKAIDDITEDETAMTISFVACRPALVTPAPSVSTKDVEAGSFTLSWDAVERAAGYELELIEIASAPDTPEEALQCEFDFAKCYSATTGYSDISSSLANYDLSGWSGSKLYVTPNKLRIGTSSTAGYIRTDTWKVPDSQDLTVVMGANVHTAGKTVKGTLQLSYGNQGDYPTNESQSFEVTADGKQVFHFTVRKDLFFLTIQPSSQMYLNYLAIYDGTWSASQLGISGSSAPRKAGTAQTFTTTEPSYTFTGLSTANRYLYRVRAVGEAGNYSQWSEQQMLSFTSTDPTAIQLLPTTEEQPVAAPRYYDLQGREVDASHRGIVIRRQGKEVKKMVKK